jgi:hypothetical protein
MMNTCSWPITEAPELSWKYKYTNYVLIYAFTVHISYIYAHAIISLMHKHYYHPLWLFFGLSKNSIRLIITCTRSVKNRLHKRTLEVSCIWFMYLNCNLKQNNCIHENRKFYIHKINSKKFNTTCNRHALFTLVQMVNSLLVTSSGFNNVEKATLWILILHITCWCMEKWRF